jgi:hypothetical protein
MSETATTSCERCSTPLEMGDLRCTICGQVTHVETTARQQTEVKVHRCTGCGAAVAYDSKRQAPSCTFCEELVEVETIEDPIDQTEGYLPFTIDKSESRQALSSWLGSLGWFRPSDLKSAARLDSLKPLWWVGWVFDADAEVSWAADSNHGAGRSRWAPHSGRDSMVFESILVSASRGLTDKEATSISSGYDLQTVSSQPQGAENATIEQFDLQRSQARQQIITAIESMAESRVAMHHVPGTESRNVNASVLLKRLVTQRFSFPAWIMAYRYKNRLYRVVINGQDGAEVSGSAPLSWWKVLFVALLSVGVVLLLIAAFAAM